MTGDPAIPRSPRRVATLVRHLTEAAEEARRGHGALREVAGALLDVAAEGPDGLALLARGLASSRALDAVAILVRGREGWEAAAAEGIDARAVAAHGPGVLAGEAERSRRPATATGARAMSAPFPQGTRAAAAVPMLSRGGVVGAVLGGSRTAEALGEDDLLLLRLAAERAGRTLERRALVDALVAAEAVARRTATFRDQMLGIVGHDLRNPLGAIVMSAALLAKRGGLAGWQGKTVGRVRSSAARMHRLIDDLLGYTRNRLGGGIPIVPRPADLGELARRVVDELVAFHPDRAVHVEASGDLGGEWDAARLEQMLSNLLSNALDHGEEPHRIEVTLRGEGSRVEVEVRNRGEMPPVARDHAFEPFRRPPDGESRRASGLGLGLYIAREIVRGHGGTIALASRAGETRVSVTLPRSAAAADARAP